MSNGQTIEGLINWVRREDWRAEMEAAFDHHIGAACRSADIDLDELAAIVGDNAVANLWGCAFEDFVSSGPEGRNAADEYLKRRGWKEPAGTRAYIQALRHSKMSLYEVSDIVVGESFLARDLVRGGEPVRVFERSATRSLSPWDRIAARVVTASGRTQITGALLAFDHQLAEKALASLDRVRKKARAEAVKLARSLGRQMDEDEIASMTGVDEVLAGSAFMFSNMWLDDVLRRTLNPTLPKLQNTDGDPLEFITLHFPLASKAGPKAVRMALDGVSSLRKENDVFWNWVETRTPAAKPMQKATPAQTFGTTMDDGATVLGNVELRGRVLTLSVNSEPRSVRGRALLEPVLAGLVRAPLTERQTVEQMMESRRDRGSPAVEESPLPPDELRSAVHQRMTDHYRETLDEPIPALGNRSPRKTAKTAKGRESVIAWLKMLENRTASLGADDPMASYDFTWLWQELGVEEQRR
mgnify:CR=1 FL=1